MKPDFDLRQDIEKCQQTLLDKHRDHYYAALFSDPDYRDLLTASFAFLEELRLIPHSCSEAGVARTKLAWWAEELQRLKHGEARHPSTRALQHLDLPHPLFEQYLDGVMRDLEYDAYPGEAELLDLARRIGGTGARITAVLLGLDDAQQNAAEHTGTALLLAGLILDVGAHANAGRVYIPLDVLEAAGIPPVNLQAESADQQLRKVLEKQSGAIHKKLSGSVDALDARLNHLNILVRFQGLRFEQAARGRHDLLASRPSLSPIRQLWVAWRSARRAG